MEDSQDFTDVSRTRIGSDEAWMTLRAETAEEVAAALSRLPGFHLDVRVDTNLVEARVSQPSETATPSTLAAALAPPAPVPTPSRSDESRAGTECDRPGSSRWEPEP